MPAVIFKDSDADLHTLDQKTVAVIGYGNQGHAHALNLRDSGINVVVGQREDSKGFARAVADGFAPVAIADAISKADLIAILLPDESMPQIFAESIKPFLSHDKMILLAHGFNILYRRISLPKETGVILVSPNGPGHLLRSEFQIGRGLPAMFAWEPAGEERLKWIGLAYARAIGCTRAGVVQTTIREETESDLFAEQVVLCGGLSALAKSAYETLTAAGFQPEVAYICCVQELRFLADLIQKNGLSGTRERISTTAEYGDYTRGPRIINEETQAEMSRILEEIQSGRFAKEWIGEFESGCLNLTADRAVHKNHPMEEVGRRVREMMFPKSAPSS